MNMYNNVLKIMVVGIICLRPMAFAKPLSSGEAKAHQNHGLPTPDVTLLESTTEIPFTIHPEFPAPVVNVLIDGKGPFRLVVDTGTSGTVVLRKSVADKLELKTVGYAMIGDGSNKNRKKVPLISIDSVTVGKVKISNILSIANEPSKDHAASIPDDLDGILGMQLFTDLLLTIDYPNSKLRISEYNEASIQSGNFIPYNYDNSAIEIQVDIADQSIPIYVDSGHRGTISLPKSYSETLPLSGSLQPIGKIATATNTYNRKKATIDASVMLAGFELIDPPIVFADEHSPKLMGYGVLEHFAITIDQRKKRINFERELNGPIKEIKLFKEQI